MFLRSTAFLLLVLSNLPSARCGILKDIAADLIKPNGTIGHLIDNRVPLEKEVESGCLWRGTAPFCKGSCIGWEIQERISSSEDEKIFGSTCWTGQKALCCFQNDQDAEWDGLWQSVQTGDLFNCTMTDRYEGKFSVTNFLTSQTKYASIAGDSIYFFDEVGTKENGKITWKKEEKKVNSWYKASKDKVDLYVR